MQDNNKFVAEWIKFATDDLFVAKHLFYEVNPKQLYISCYHCQQCAEKMLKAFLIGKDWDLLKIHDLNMLCNLCIDRDHSFEDIQELCAFVNPYGVEVKYPNNTELYDEIVEIVLNRTQKIYDFCKIKVGL